MACSSSTFQPRCLGNIGRLRSHRLAAPTRAYRSRSSCSVRAALTADLKPAPVSSHKRSLGSHGTTRGSSSNVTALSHGQQQQRRRVPDHEHVDVKRAYRAPASDLPGVAAAVGVLTAWALVFKHSVFCYDLSAPLTLPHVLEGIACFMTMEFLSTGLFITTHDAMHQAVAPNNKLLNDIIGNLCISLYAWFDYGKMHKKHWEHHNECGTPGADPDFHTGDDSLRKWYLNFMKTYVSVPQFVKLQLVSTLLMNVGHAPLINLLLFWAGAGMVSAGRLFYFGTYEPHRPDAEAWAEGEPPGSMPWWRARTTDAPTWLTFLRCWNFSLHVEHHQYPTAPYWDLPKAKSARDAVLSGKPLQQPQVAPTPELVPVPVMAATATRAASGVEQMMRYASAELRATVSSLSSYGSMDLAYASVEL